MFPSSRITLLALWAALFSLWIGACSDDKKSDPTDGGSTDTDADTDTDSDADADAGDGCIETASGTFPSGVEEIIWDNGGADSTIADYTWNPLTIGSNTYTIGEESMWEAVRFDLDSPATVYGARVQWGNITPGDERPVTLGLYGDFGGNGFDFDRWTPLREGDRCLTEEDEGAFTDYVFETPHEVEIPGLIYVAHYFEPADEPLFMMDPTSLECDLFDDCHSSINLPEAETTTYYNGVSLGFPYDFSVRLVVERHDTIPQSHKWFQPSGFTVSRRVAFGDYDNDGDDDLMSNGPTLYRNEGDGTFTDVTTAAGLDAVSGCGGGVFGDYDNDGYLDYICQGTGKTAWDPLLHNNGDGTFSDVTAASGIDDVQTTVDCDTTTSGPEYSPTEGVAWVDLDNDGLLDIYQAQYECWQDTTSANYLDRIWHNDGGGVFSEWDDTHGFNTSRQAGRGVSPIDYDLDGDMDIFVSNYRLDPNFLYVGDGSGAFTDEASSSGLIGTYVSGAYGHTIGAAWLDAENDGDWDIFLGNLAHPRFYNFSDLSQLMINDGAGAFTDTAQAAGIIYRETHSNPTAADFDNDGFTDLFITCVYEGRDSDMYLNNGDGTFSPANYESGAVVQNGWGSAASDFDNDGDVDLIADELFVNESAADGNNWIQVRALGGAGGSGTINAAGIGSVVTVTAGSDTYMRHTSGGSGTGCQDSMFLSFGLGAHTEADEILVSYPGGHTVTVQGPIAAGQRVWVEADGTVTYGWAHP